jgi:nucleolar protein 15
MRIGHKVTGVTVTNKSDFLYMPESKIRSKAASIERAKRKRETDADTPSIDKSATGKPTKKVRKDGSINATLTNVRRNATQKPNVETNPKSTQVDGQGARKTVGRQQQQVAPTNSVTLDEEGRSDHDSPALEEAEEDEIQLQGFSSESDSSDEDLDVKDAPPLDISTMPSFFKDDAVVQRKLEKAKKNPVG